MKVLIIGAKGMLGQELNMAFKEYQPLLWDKEEIDISDKSMVKRKIKAEKPDLIINAAAYNDVDGAEKNEVLANKINGDGPGYLAKAISTSGGILVHYSTDYVFKGDNKQGYMEDDQPDPQSAYARSKLRGEQQVQQNCKNFYLVRLSKLFGQPASSILAKKSFIDTMIELSATKDEIDVIDEELSSPTYAPDLARRTREIVEQQKPFGIYHASNSGACTWFDLCKEIYLLKKINVKINSVPSSNFTRLAKRPQYSILINTKLQKMRNWQEALKEYLS